MPKETEDIYELTGTGTGWLKINILRFERHNVLKYQNICISELDAPKPSLLYFSNKIDPFFTKADPL